MHTTNHLPQQSRSRHAVTLVEVMIAMFILVVGVGTLFESLVTSQRVNERATNQAKAYEEIQAQIESLQYMPFSTVHKYFKGIAFNVDGLTPIDGAATCGTVTRLSNPNPDDTTINPNPNKFPSTAQVLPLRFRVAWLDQEGPSSVETVYVMTNRGQ
jgi:type II secretory pathway pseudopilin PulG